MANRRAGRRGVALTIQAYFSSRRWALGYGVLLGLVLLLPYAVAWQMEGDAWRFSGFLLGVVDGNSYIAKMLTGTTGAWLFHPPYTTQAVPPLPLFWFYILAGKLAAAPALHLQLAVGYHLLRFVGIVLLSLATYDFVSAFLDSEAARRWAVVLATAGAGLGWVVMPWLRLGWAGALCFYSPEAYGFLGALLLAHWTWARAALLWALVLVLKGAPARRSLFATLGLILLMVLTQPLELAIFAAVVGAWGCGLICSSGFRRAAWRGLWRRWRLSAAFPFAVAAALAVGYAFLAHFHPYLRLWSSQSPLPAPPFWQYLLAYGWLILLALPGIGYWRGRRWRGTMLWAWVGVFPLLAYLPISAQRRLVDGVWVALSVLAAAGVWALPKPRVSKLVAYGAVVVAMLPSLFIWMGALRLALNPHPPVFLPAAEVEAFQHLAASASVGDGVLAAFPTANALPAWAPVRVIDGMGTESPNFKHVVCEVKKFYSLGATNSWRYAFLRQHHLRWVFLGNTERALGNWNPSNAEFLCLRYKDKGYSFWEVCR